MYIAKPVNRLFQASWFNRFHWLHYDTVLDSAFCFVCCKAIKQKKVLITGVAENAFIIDGFNNWKDATRVYSKHEASYFHKQAFDSLKVRADVGEMLSSQYAQEKRTNRKYLMQVLSSVRYLAWQGLAMRGDKHETNSNFYQLLLLLLHATDNSDMLSLLDGKKFTSPEIQNELIYIMAQQILPLIVQRFQSKYFIIMIDQATDVSNSEQVVIVLRWVDEDLSVQEDFIRLYKTESTNAATLVSLIKDVLLHCNLSISMCRGQCYDGASVMTGVKSGVSTLIMKEES